MECLTSRACAYPPTNSLPFWFEHNIQSEQCLNKSEEIVFNSLIKLWNSDIGLSLKIIIRYL